PGPGPAWGAPHHGGGHYGRKGHKGQRGWVGMLFSS
ncbi:zf-TFIIB domain containing protein, partial [Nonomuraea diastatica]